MSHFLTKGLVESAVRIVIPSIEGVLGSHYTGSERNSLHLVVLKPGTEEILYECAFGADKSTWKRPFDDIARAKARFCQRTGMVGRNARMDAPWLYESGDTRFVGGVIENGLAVAASGLQDYFDEMFSWMVLGAIQGLCRQWIDDLHPDAPAFLGW